ncbi:MAG: sulfatase [Armatimonadota bacterium]|jgi:arylsulfatase A-like enzyme
MSDRLASATPNLLFVFADQMRAQDCGFMGSAQVRTPSMNRMADEGVVFENAVSSCPVCTPYRASLLTGRYPLACRTAMNDVRLPVDELSIAEVLGDAGYATGYIGKWHLDGPYRGGFTPPGPRRQGFQYWAANECTHRYLNTFYYRDDPEPIFIDGYSSDGFTEIAIDYIRDHADEPFCLFISWAPPHNPYHEMPERYDIYDPAGVDLRPNTEEFAREDIAGYYGHITALDRNLGRLLLELEEQGIAEDTIVVFTSDHGDMLGAHGMERKQKPWDESIMVPWVMQWPGGLPAGMRTDTLINAPDIMPTLLSLMGVEIPDTVQGYDLSGAARGTGGIEPTSAYIANPMPFPGDRHDMGAWRGVRTKTHTYVEDERGPWLLYDNEADPFQQRNLIDSPETEHLRHELRAELAGWMDEIGDDGASKDELVERFGYELDERGVVPYFGETGLHDPDNED